MVKALLIFWLSVLIIGAWIYFHHISFVWVLITIMGLFIILGASFMVCAFYDDFKSDRPFIGWGD